MDGASRTGQQVSVFLPLDKKTNRQKDRKTKIQIDKQRNIQNTKNTNRQKDKTGQQVWSAFVFGSNRSVFNLFSFLIFANWFGVHLGGWFAHTALFCLLGNRQKKDEQTKNDSWEETRDRNDTFARCYVYLFLQFSFFSRKFTWCLIPYFQKKSEKVAEGIFVSFFIHISLPFCFVFVYILHSYLVTFGFVFVQLWCLWLCVWCLLGGREQKWHAYSRLMAPLDTRRN